MNENDTELNEMVLDLPELAPTDDELDARFCSETAQYIADEKRRAEKVVSAALEYLTAVCMADDWNRRGMQFMVDNCLRTAREKQHKVAFFNAGMSEDV